MNTLKDLFIFFSQIIKDKPLCIETGVQHNFEKDNINYYSTLNLIRYLVQPKNGILYSIDNDKSHIESCKSKIMESDKTIKYINYIRFINGDSVEQLKNLINIITLNSDRKIDLIFLDSKDFDEEHMLNEFKILESYLSDKCIIMCDDIHNPSSTKYKKAVPYIKKRVNLWFEYNTPTGLFVGIKNS